MRTPDHEAERQEDKHATTEVHPGPGSDISEPRSTSLSLKSTGHNRRREHKTWYSVAAVFAGAAALLVASLIARPMLPVFKLHTHEHQNTEGTPLLDLKQAALVWPASDWGADILIPARRSLSASDVPAESVNVADVSTCDIVIGYTAFDEIENAQDVLPKTSLFGIVAMTDLRDRELDPISSWGLAWDFEGGEIFKPQGSLLDNAKSLPGKKESSMILLSESAAGDVEDEEFTLAGAERQQLVKFSAGKGPLDDNGFRIRPVANMVFNNLNCLPLGTAFTDENNGSPEQSDDSKPCVYPTGSLELLYRPIILSKDDPSGSPFTQMILTVQNRSASSIPLQDVAFEYFFAGAEGITDPNEYQVFCMDFQAAPFLRGCDFGFAYSIDATADEDVYPGASFVLRGSFKPSKSLQSIGIQDQVVLLPANIAQKMETSEPVVSAIQEYYQEPSSATLEQVLSRSCEISDEACEPWAVNSRIILSLETRSKQPMRLNQDFSFQDTADIQNPDRRKQYEDQGLAPKERESNIYIPLYTQHDSDGRQHVWGTTPGHHPCRKSKIPQGYVCPNEEPTEAEKPSCFVQVDYCCAGEEPLATVVPEPWGPIPVDQSGSGKTIVELLKPVEAIPESDQDGVKEENAKNGIELGVVVGAAMGGIGGVVVMTGLLIARRKWKQKKKHAATKASRSHGSMGTMPPQTPGGTGLDADDGLLDRPGFIVPPHLHTFYGTINSAPDSAGTGIATHSTVNDLPNFSRPRLLVVPEVTGSQREDTPKEGTPSTRTGSQANADIRRSAHKVNDLDSTRSARVIDLSPPHERRNRADGSPGPNEPASDLVLAPPATISPHSTATQSPWPSPTGLRVIDMGTIEKSRLLGRGAYGEVWAGTWAKDINPIEVAVKIIHTDTTTSYHSSMDVARSIQQELYLLTTLSHPRIVKCFGGGLDPHPFMVMELVPRGSLDRLIHPEGGELARLSYISTLSLCIDVGAALAYLHPAGIVHRDLKPHNILVEEDGHAKLADFGIAKMRDPDATMTKFLLSKNDGTPFYMAPEVLQSKKVTEKCDIYSLGIVLIECFSGERPWSELSDPFQVVFKVCVEHARPSLPSHCPRPFRRLVDRMLHPNPLLRPSAPDIVVEASRLKREAEAVLPARSTS